MFCAVLSCAMLSCFSCVRLSATLWTILHWAPLSMGFSKQNTGVGCHFLLQGIFPTEASNLGLPHCRQILYHLSHQVKWLRAYPTLANPMDFSPPSSSIHGISQARILEWVAISFSRGSSQPRDRTWVSCIAVRLLTL